MAYEVRQVLPSESAESWARAGLNQANADTARRNLELGMPEAELAAKQAQTEYHKALGEGQVLTNDTARLQKEMLLKEREGAQAYLKALETKAQQPVAAPVAQAAQAQSTTGANVTGAAAPAATPAPAYMGVGSSPAAGGQEQAPSVQTPQTEQATPVQAIVGKTPAEESPVAKAVKKNSALGGLDNHFSDDNIQLYLKSLLDAGVPYARAMELAQGRITTRNKLIEDNEKILTSEATRGKTDVERQGLQEKLQAEHAMEVFKYMRPKNADGSANPMYDPTRAADLGASYGFKNAADVMNWAQRSESFDAEAKRTVEDRKIANQERDTTSLIKRRIDETVRDQETARHNKVDEAISRGNLRTSQLKEVDALSTKITADTRTAMTTSMLNEDINMAKKLLPYVQRDAKTGAYYATQNLPPELRNQAAAYLGAQVASDGTLQLDNLMKRIGSGITEVRAAAYAAGGARGQAGSDKRMKLLEDSVAGNGLDISKSAPIIADSLDYVARVAANENASAHSSINVRNQMVKELSGGKLDFSGNIQAPKIGETKPAGGVKPLQVGPAGEGYDKVPPGGTYVGPDGKTYRKGGQ